MRRLVVIFACLGTTVSEPLNPKLFSDQWSSSQEPVGKGFCQCQWLNNQCFYFMRLGVQFPYESFDAMAAYLGDWAWILLQGCEADDKQTFTLAFPISLIRMLICLFKSFLLGTQDHLWQLARQALATRKAMHGCISSSPWGHARLLTDPGIWNVLGNLSFPATQIKGKWRKFFRNWRGIVRTTPAPAPLNEAYRRCIPLSKKCWGMESSNLMSSCLSCCSPYEGPRGTFGCFSEDFNFQRCCRSETSARSVVDATDVAAVAALVPKVEVTARKPLAGLNFKIRSADWTEVRTEYAQKCIGQESPSASDTLASRAREVDHWARYGAEPQRIFHASDLYMALRTCTKGDVWSAIGSGEDGAALWYEAGTLCTNTLELITGDCCTSLGVVTRERRARHGRFTILPCSGLVEERHYAFPLGSYGLLNMDASPSPEDSESECPERDVDAVAILIGHPGFTSVGHALHDFAFLANVFRLASHGAFRSISTKFHIVPVKWYLKKWDEEEWELKWQLPKKVFANGLMPLARLWFDAALKFGDGLDYDIFNVTFDNLKCWRCYLATVQQWRFMSGDADFWNEYRASMLELCDIMNAPVLPFKKKVVILQRTRYVRGLANIAEIAATLLRSTPEGWEVQVAVLGDLHEPCDQLRTVYDASVLLSVSGTEPYFGLIMPEKAAVISIDSNTMEHENVTQNQDGSDEFWARLQDEVSRRCRGWMYRSRGRPELSSLDSTHGVASARNLWYTSLNNATCLQIPGTNCRSAWTMGLVEADAEALGRIVAAAISDHLSQWLT